MHLFKCSCKQEVEQLKKELKDFKELVNIDRFASWVRLLQDSTNKINGYHEIYKETMNKLEEYLAQKERRKGNNARSSNL